MIKKIAVSVFIGQFLAMALITPVVNAQGVGTGSGASGYGYAAPGGIISPGMPSETYPVPVESGFIQFNNLTVEGVSGVNPPAEILASNPNVYPIPMMEESTGGTVGVGVPAMPPAMLSSAPSSATCYKFDTQNSARGRAIPCPARVATSTTQSAPNAAASGSAANPKIYPPPPYPSPSYYRPYRIEVDASTRLLLRDRTSATLSNFSSGDQINVFGYYNSDGSIQAYLIRDLSKPAENQFIQLNNVELISISANTIPATLVVTQAQGYPCYGFGTDGATKQSIACPMGAQTTTNSPALRNLSVPPALVPNWQYLRKYVITIDAQTIILDNNRTKLLLADLQIGDQLNIFGDTTDNGQTLNADIVRDLSIPAIPSTYSGNVTQVNADGSFVIQTNDGRTFTVQNPIRVGAAVQLTGILDRLQNVLSQVSNIFFGETRCGVAVPCPLPAVAPGALRTQSGSPLPAGSGGMPNTKN